ncbi:hypothetical protein GGI18_006490, partial [Coemansia linderi]
AQLTDAELFAACEGRTARKGARAEQSGKLARVAGMARPEVAARIEAALSGRLPEQVEVAVTAKRKRSKDEETEDRKKKSRESKSDKKKRSGEKKEKRKSKDKKSKSKTSFDPVYCADSLEFCPYNAKQRFLIGTYQLLKTGNASDQAATDDNQELTSADAQRVGRIYVCDFAEGDSGPGIVERQRIETSAIFDIKWSYNRVNGRELVGAACADGKVHVYAADDSSSEDSYLSLLGASDSESSMCCSLDWSNRLAESSSPEI